MPIKPDPAPIPDPVPVVKPAPVPISAKDATAVKAWLLARGQKSAAVAALKLSDTQTERKELCALHGVSEAEYRAAGGLL